MADDKNKDKAQDKDKAQAVQPSEKGAELSEQGGGESSSDLKEAMATLQRRAAQPTEEGTTAEGSASRGIEGVVDGEMGDGAENNENNKNNKGSSSENLSDGAGVEVVSPVYEAKHDKLGRSYATGKRKTSIVRVWLSRGSGEIKVNGKILEKYFSREVLSMVVRQPLEKASCEGIFDVMATARGGGLSGQAGALRHGLARALYLFDPSYRPALKRAGFLTRDSRIVERKKYGRPKARRSFQFSKR